jgi:hypothetical protein
MTRGVLVVAGAQGSGSLRELKSPKAAVIYGNPKVAASRNFRVKNIMDRLFSMIVLPSNDVPSGMRYVVFVGLTEYSAYPLP